MKGLPKLPGKTVFSFGLGAASGRGGGSGKVRFARPPARLNTPLTDTDPDGGLHSGAAAGDPDYKITDAAKALEGAPTVAEELQAAPTAAAALKDAPSVFAPTKSQDTDGSVDPDDADDYDNDAGDDDDGSDGSDADDGSDDSSDAAGPEDAAPDDASIDPKTVAAMTAPSFDPTTDDSGGGLDQISQQVAALQEQVDAISQQLDTLMVGG